MPPLAVAESVLILGEPMTPPSTSANRARVAGLYLTINGIRTSRPRAQIRFEGPRRARLYVDLPEELGDRIGGEQAVVGQALHVLGQRSRERRLSITPSITTCATWMFLGPSSRAIDCATWRKPPCGGERGELRRAAHRGRGAGEKDRPLPRGVIAAAASRPKRNPA